jgi:hypothetical protein
LVLDRLRALGLCDVEADALGNVYARRPGRATRPALLIAAHLDTVFPRETDLRLRYEGARVYGPGLGDNSTGVAGLIHLAQVMQRYDVPNQGDIWFGDWRAPLPYRGPLARRALVGQLWHAKRHSRAGAARGAHRRAFGAP